MKVCIIGAGSMGTALGLHLSRNGHVVTLYTIERDVFVSLKKHKSKYFPGISIPLSCVNIIPKADCYVLAVPSAVVPKIIKELPKNAFVLSVCKGFVKGKLLCDYLGRNYAVLQGPINAKELARGLPCVGVVSGPTRIKASKLLKSKNFGVVIENDVKSVLLGGAFKNVVAIAAGLCDGAGLGANFKSFVVCEGFREMLCFARKMNLDVKPLFGPAGLGDLLLTCCYESSRNRCLGELVAKGVSKSEALKQIGQVVEGVDTAKEVCKLFDSKLAKLVVSSVESGFDKDKFVKAFI